MKKNTIIGLALSTILVCSVSTIVFGQDFLQEYLDKNDTATQTAKKNEELRSHINKKLEEYGRMQQALEAIDTMDAEDFGIGTGGTTGFSTKEAANRVTTLGSDIDNVISEIEKIQEKRKENEEHYKDILGQVKRVIIDIKTTKQSVTDSVTKINLYTQRMIDNIKNLEETRKYLQNTRSSLQKLLPALFMIQNAYTNQAGSIDDLKLILDDQSFNETLSFDDMIQGLSAKLDTTLGELVVAQEKYTNNIKELHETRKKLKKATLTYQEKINVLEEQKAYLLDFLSLYKNNKVRLDQTISNLFETRAQLNQRIAKTIDQITKIRNSEVFTKNEIFVNFMNEKDDREKRANYFGWSVLPVTNIPVFFGDTIKVGDKEEVFNGIQIDAEQGQELYAPADGLVYYVQDQNSIGINRMIIMHKDGYVTVFTNVNKILVQKQEIVKRGQIIGLVGGQPGTRGAGWFSRQAGVHMQLFKHGKAIDPLQLLDLSVINTPSILPELYQVKYDTDIRMRSNVIDFTSVKFMAGNTVRERRLRFLDTVAAGPYADIVLWEQAAEGLNLDIDLGICIGYAETSMGRHFASDNNIGNVGNNDRGDRVDKDSPLDGARAIYQTLNNQYLGGYDTIYELSGYGNKDGAIYASSEYNWQKNVSRCLSTIKGYIVPEDYPFRTYSEAE